jgi:DNA polymerase III delta subunit
MHNLTPENVLTFLQKGAFASFYLFYGPEDFWLEITLDKIKKDFIPDKVKAFNVETLYGSEISAHEILSRAHLVPFMSPHRLLERQVYSWLQKRAKELELDIDKEASSFIYQIVGSSLRDLFSEIFKLSLRYPHSRIGVEEIKEMTTFSRLFTVFDLVDHVSKKDTFHAIVVLNKLFETQGRDATTLLGLLGMLARQIRLILKAKSGLKKGGGRSEAIKRLQPLPTFVIEKYLAQERFWQEEELEKALDNIYDADGFIRTGSKGDLILENLIFLLCFPRHS